MHKEKHKIGMCFCVQAIVCDEPKQWIQNTNQTRLIPLVKKKQGRKKATKKLFESIPPGPKNGSLQKDVKSENGESLGQGVFKENSKRKVCNGAFLPPQIVFHKFKGKKYAWKWWEGLPAAKTQNLRLAPDFFACDLNLANFGSKWGIPMPKIEFFFQN